MSNYVRTTITIPRSEYNQMQSAAANATSLRNQVNNLTRENGTLQNNLNAANNRLQQSNQKYEQAIADLRRQNSANTARNAQLQAEINNAYESCNSRIVANQTEMQENLQQLRDDMGNYVAASIAANNEVIQELINDNNAHITSMITTLQANTEAGLDEVRNDLNAVKTGLDGLLDSAQALRDAAEDYMDQVDNLALQIADTRHEVLMPGRYAELQTVIDRARADVTACATNDILTSVAYDHARTAFEESLRFFESAMLAEQEWQAQLTATEQLASVLEAQIESCSTIEPKPGVSLDVDYWSNDDLSANRATFRQIRENLQNPEQLSTQQLIDMQNSFQMVSTNVDRAVADAWVAVHTSQNIARTAQRIYRQLERSGNLTVTSHSYEDGDKRGNYRFILTNAGTGMNVVVTVSVIRDGDDVSVEAEADITNYGTMPVAAAEQMVRDAIQAVTSGIPGQPAVTCQSTGQVLHPERANLHEWSGHTHQETVATHPNPNGTTQNTH